MSTVPYIFANVIGNISLNELDSNFANVETDSAQPAITSVTNYSINKRCTVLDYSINNVSLETIY
jgi:hypothetical protein